MAERYLFMWRVQKYLRDLYLILFVIAVVMTYGFAYKGMDLEKGVLLPGYAARFRRAWFGYIGFFVVSLASFELYIHVFHPLNTLSYIFPVKFPFF